MSSENNTSARVRAFGQYRLDPDSHRLWRGQEAIALRPKSWDVLSYLVDHAGALVTKATLHDAIWHGAAVSEDTLTQCIGELRRILGDSPRTPRFIETVHRHGFRFIAETQVLPHPTLPTGTAPMSPQSAATWFVGRDAELDQLNACLDRARQGERQIAFVTGEAGIGKTTLIREFCRLQTERTADLRILYGQCVQQKGQREAFMPILEALERFLRSSAGTSLSPLLRRLAPSWYTLMPSLHAESELSATPDGMKPVPPARMLRTIGMFFEMMTADDVVVLLLEDLHWSDPSTTDVLAFLAQRPDPAKLFVIATYRLAEATVTDHPIREVKQALQLRRHCTHLPLQYLSVAEVQAHLQARLGVEIDGLAAQIHGRTDGNPLFISAMLAELMRRGWLTKSNGAWQLSSSHSQIEGAVPDDVREMITSQLHRLDEAERSVLEAASVMGVSFAPSTIATVLGREEETVDLTCRQLLENHLFLSQPIKPAGTTPVNERAYSFAHALYRQVIYEQLPGVRRARFHLAIGNQIEEMHSTRRDEHAAELATHFELAGDWERAIRYLCVCVTHALGQRGAHREAIVSINHALQLLEHVPESRQRAEQELDLRLALNPSLNVTYGYRSAAVQANCASARQVCETLGDQRRLFEIVHAQWYAQGCGHEREGVWDRVDELAGIAKAVGSRALRQRAELARGRTEFWNGRFSDAASTLGAFLENQLPGVASPSTVSFGVDPIVAAHTHRGLALWFLGFPDRARAEMRAALDRAAHTKEPFDITSALVMTALTDLLCRNPSEALAKAERAATICVDADVAFFAPVARFISGAAQIQLGEVAQGLNELNASLADQQTISGSFFCDIILAFIADAHLKRGDWEAGLERAEEGIALTEVMVEQLFAAELWRLKGELLMRRQRAATAKRVRIDYDEARSCFHRALAIAEGQGARSFALRAAMSLKRSAAHRHDAGEAHALLDSLYASFTEGFTTTDVQDAEALLAAAP